MRGFIDHCQRSVRTSADFSGGHSGGIAPIIGGEVAQMREYATRCFSRESPGSRVEADISCRISPSAGLKTIVGVFIVSEVVFGDVWGVKVLGELLPPEKRGYEFLHTQSDLLPAFILESRTRQISLFNALADWGLDGPRYAVFVRAGKVTFLERGKQYGGSAMDENWLLFWFAGGEGWDEITYAPRVSWYRTKRPETGSLPAFDVPLLVVLQRRPEALILSDENFQLRFPQACGHIIIMPLFGLKKFAPARTKRWAESFPDELTAHCRKWSRILRSIPVQCRETFRVNREKDEVAVFQDFEYFQIEDDWSTPAIRIAPLPPPLAIAMRNGFPLKVSTELVDDGIALAYGPYLYALGDSCSYTIEGMLKYINSIMTSEGLDEAKHPVVREAIKELTRWIDRNPMGDFNDGGGYARGFSIMLVRYFEGWRFISDEVKKRSLPLVRNKIREMLLDARRYRSCRHYPPPLRHRYLREPCGHYKDSLKITQALPQGLWSYAYHTGDWELIKQNWELIRKWFYLPTESNWTAIHPAGWAGQDIIRGAIQGTIGYARLAHFVGDAEEYERACYLLAKTLAVEYAKYFLKAYWRSNEPWNVQVKDEFVIPWTVQSEYGFTVMPSVCYMDRFTAPGAGTMTAWDETYFEITRETWRFYRDYLSAEMKWVFDDFLPQVSPLMYEFGYHGQYRAYIANYTPEQLWQIYRKLDLLRQRCRNENLGNLYKFNSSHIQTLVAVLEKAGRIVEKPVIPPGASSGQLREGCSLWAEETKQGQMTPAFTPFTYLGRGWVGIAWRAMYTPRMPEFVRKSRWSPGLLPFGFIVPGSRRVKDKWNGVQRVNQSFNWCLPATIYVGLPLLEVKTILAPDGATVVEWQTDEESSSSLRYWEHDIAGTQAHRPYRVLTDDTLVKSHRMRVKLPEGVPYDIVVWSTNRAGLSRSSRTLSSPHYPNLAVGKDVYAPKPHPYYTREFNRSIRLWVREEAKKQGWKHPAWHMARKREEWLKKNPNWYAAHRGEFIKLQSNEMNNGLGDRRGVRPATFVADIDPTYVHWFVFDLGEPTVFSRVAIAHEYTTLPNSFRIDVGGTPETGWEDSAWQTVLVEEPDNRRVVSRYQFKPTRARYVRLRYRNLVPPERKLNRVSIIEFELYR